MARKRSYITGLSRLLAAHAYPVYALDADRVVVYCNTACMEWTRLSADELVGRRCNYTSGFRNDGSTDPLSGLCPPPEAFQARPVTAEVACRDETGRWTDCTAECFPLLDGKGGCLGVLVIVCPEGHAREPQPAAPDLSATQLHGRLRSLMQELGMPGLGGHVVGRNQAIDRIRRQIQVATGSDSRILVSGPPGSGREHIARSIHYGGTQASSPLTPLACHLLDSELLESTITSFAASCAELEMERPATLLLLEVDQLQSDAQAALAGILSIGELNVRTIATVRTPLIELAAQDRYRRDLAFALSTLVIQVPALADRTEDIPLLAQFFLEQRNSAGEKQFAGFSNDAMDQLVAYPWPENVDELAELVHQACDVATGPVILPGDLPEKIRFAASAQAYPAQAEERIVLDQFLADIERELLVRAMRRSKGNRARAARLLGLSRARLLRRLEHFGIEGG
jgi:DNA-binding NtrC family response regulator